MEGGESSGKRASAEEVKSDIEEGEVLMTQDGGGGGRALAAAEPMAPAQINVRMDLTLLHCQGCLLPLKPPVFKCEAAGHVVCYHCRAVHGTICSRARTHCGELDAVVGAAKVPCPYRAFGCERQVVYHEAADHQRACECAPCSCPDHTCAFAGSRATLLDHFAAAHRRPAATVRYGRSRDLGLSPSHRWHALVGEEDGSVFLVSLSPLGAATAVSLVCVRQDSEAAPQFWCKLSVERLGGGNRDRLVLMASPVGSSALSTGAPAPGQGMFLAVPHEMLSGDTLTLTVRIDLIRPAPVPAAPMSTTQQARTQRRMQ
ncbi:E3 ubiquitin-protein ligase SINA-like protein 10 [Hordeum vulgare]|nr:E3 ubiquitin-protein ligase SINA-like protein 10 [Hordeum vulgare]